MTQMEITFTNKRGGRVDKIPLQWRHLFLPCTPPTNLCDPNLKGMEDPTWWCRGGKFSVSNHWCQYKLPCQGNENWKIVFDYMFLSFTFHFLDIKPRVADLSNYQRCSLLLPWLHEVMFCIQFMKSVWAVNNDLLILVAILMGWGLGKYIFLATIKSIWLGLYSNTTLIICI